MLQLIEKSKVREAIDAFINVTNPDVEMSSCGRTPLVAACIFFNDIYYPTQQNIETLWYELIEILLQKGSNPNHIKLNSGPPLLEVINSLNSNKMKIEIIRMLLYYNADINIKRCVLLNACSHIYLYPDMIKFLLQSGVCCTNKDPIVGTPYNYIDECIEKCNSSSDHNKNYKKYLDVHYMLKYGWISYDKKQQIEENKKQTLQEMKTQEMKTQEMKVQEMKTQEIKELSLQTIEKNNKDKEKQKQEKTQDLLLKLNDVMYQMHQLSSTYINLREEYNVLEKRKEY